MGELDGKIGLVTGSTRGIGLAIAARFAAEGARVYVHGRREESAEQAAAGLPNAAFAAAELDRPGEAARLVDEVVAAAGRIDFLVNNAGVAVDNFVLGVTPPRWQEVIDVNLTAAFFALQAAGLHMREAGGGAIVNVISWAGIRGNIGQVAYSASKAGLVGVTLTAAKELAKFGIRVNALSPVIESDMTDQMAPELRAEALARVPLGRFGTAEEMAEGALWLTSDRSRYTTGMILHVDGGMHLY
ncbi:MAG: SDR family NAD(P)-dependent oxidoreductase [Acidimicrobiales bacterium]